tara:strand:- start:372 stop:701 length:330 start_codon:yes stop_codon:yes gene_type:complete
MERPSPFFLFGCQTTSIRCIFRDEQLIVGGHIDGLHGLRYQTNRMQTEDHTQKPERELCRVAYHERQQTRRYEFFSGDIVMMSDWVLIDALCLYYGTYAMLFTCTSVEW